jgi:hypothetical protein
MFMNSVGFAEVLSSWEKLLIIFDQGLGDIFV